MGECLRIVGSFVVSGYCPTCKGALSGHNVSDELGHMTAVVCCSSCSYSRKQSLDQILTKEGAEELKKKKSSKSVITKVVSAGRIASFVLSALMWFRPKSK